jgi:hypothetical protein
MKKIFLFFCLFINVLVFSQNNRVVLGYHNNADIFKSNHDYLSLDNSTVSRAKSSTFQFDVTTYLLKKNRFSIYIGLSYKRIFYIAENRIQDWNFSVQYVSGGQVMYYDVHYKFDDPADLVSKSNSFGLGTDNNLMLFEKPKISGLIGLNYRIYFLEYFNSNYYSNDPIISDSNNLYFEKRPQPNIGPIKKIFLSSINVSAYYRQVFQLHENFSLAARISLGTNLYSDWDQFKKYAWLGLGLEMGFGKVKASKVKP